MNRYIHTKDTAAWLSDSADRQTDRSTTSQPAFHSHYTRPPALAGTSSSELKRILSVQSFTGRMSLLTATSAFGLGRRRRSSAQQCHLHCQQCHLHCQQCHLHCLGRSNEQMLYDNAYQREEIEHCTRLTASFPRQPG